MHRISSHFGSTILKMFYNHGDFCSKLLMNVPFQNRDLFMSELQCMFEIDEIKDG